MESYTVFADKYSYNVKFSNVHYEPKNILRVTIPGIGCLFDINNPSDTLEHYLLGWRDEDIDILKKYLISGKYERFVELETLREQNCSKQTECPSTEHSFRYLPDLKILFCKKCGTQMSVKIV